MSWAYFLNSDNSQEFVRENELSHDDASYTINEFICVYIYVCVHICIYKPHLAVSLILVILNFRYKII